MDGGCERCGSFRGLDVSGGGGRCRDHAFRRPWVVATAAAGLASAATLAAGLAAVAETSVPATVAWVPPALLAVVVVHEGAHLLAALLTGLRVSLVLVGVGPRLAAARVRGVPVELRLLPAYGHVTVTPRGDPGRLRWRLAFLAYLAAGPATNVAVLVAAFQWLGTAPGAAACGAAAAFVLVDVMDAVTTDRHPRWHSDLYVILRHRLRPLPVYSIARPEASLEDLWAAVQDVHVTWGHRSLRPVADQVRFLAEMQPDQPSWRRLAAYVLVDERRFAEARAAFHALADADPLAAADGLATVGLLTEAPPEETRAAVRRALELAPEEPAVLLTAASVAARDGRLDEAEEQCARAAATTPWPVIRAAAAAVRAYIATRRGDEAAARAYADEARALDPDCVVLDLVATASRRTP